MGRIGASGPRTAWDARSRLEGMRRLLVGAVVLLLSFAGSLGQSVFSASAQTEWTQAQLMPGFDDSGYGPYLVADRNQTIYAFNSQFVDRSMDIVYSSWTPTDGWTSPVVIISPYRGQARLTGAVLDQQGYVHLTFFGGDDVGADMFYSKTHVSQAGRAGSWSTPIPIGPDAITPTTGALASDGEANLVFIYSGNRDNLLGNGLYEVHSTDAGTTWSEPQLIYLTETRTFWPSALQTIMGGQGKMHAVWSVASVSGNGEAVLYTSFDPDTSIRPEPIRLAEAIDFEADTPAIIEHNGELFVIYHNGSPTTRWTVRSSDAGQSWTLPILVTETIVGSNGPASMVVDGGGTMHVLFGGRTGSNPADHGMWKSVWTSESWIDPEAIAAGPAIKDKPGGEGFDPSFARAIVSQGNLLMVTWRTDPGAGPNGIWYAYTTLDTPPLPAQAVPTPAPTPAATDVPVVSADNPEKLLIVPFTEPATNQKATSMAEIITLGIVPAITIVALVVAGVQLSKSKR